MTIQTKEKRDFEIRQCANGFILYPTHGDERSYSYSARAGDVYCFNTVEDLARFIRKYYSK